MGAGAGGGAGPGAGAGAGAASPSDAITWARSASEIQPRSTTVSATGLAVSAWTFIASDIWSGVTSRKRSSCASSDTCGAGGAFGGRSAARSTGCTGALIGGSAPTGTGLSGGSSGERRGAPGG